jgi:hypothetical protein
MRGLLLISITVATAFATAILFAPHPAQAVITPTGFSAAIQQSDVKQTIYWRRRGTGLTYIGPTLTAMPTDLTRTPMPIGLIAITGQHGDCVDAR